MATVLLGTWTKEFDRVQAARVLAGAPTFDEATMLDDGIGSAGGKTRRRSRPERRRAGITGLR